MSVMPVSSESIDLHEKKDDYEANGIKEYVAILTQTRRVAWFFRKGRRLVELQPDKDGIIRSKVFPGLWLEPSAMLADDLWRIQEVLNQGLATPEHAAFVAELAKLGS
jgi:Uma2 family endonuclease